MRGLLIGLVLALGIQPAFAQTDWNGRGRLSLSAGLQPDAGGFAEETSVVKNLEAAPITANLAAAGSPFFDVGVAIRLVGNLGVGLAVSNVNAEDDAAVTAEIPHPFFFSRPRFITGEASGLRRAELGVHTDLVYLVAVSDRVDLLLQGGATFFQVKQDLVSDVTYNESYPFDEASFSSATKVQVSDSKAGYNAGVDVTWKLSPRWGVGGLVRFSRARVPLEVDGVTAATVDVGGLQAAGGLRVVF
jgi:hypothetical protein